MQFALRKGLAAVACAATLVVSTTDASNAAGSKIMHLPTGSLKHDYVVGKNQVLRVNQKVMLGKRRVTLQGGKLDLIGRIDIPTGGTLVVNGGELKGKGSIVVHPGGLLRFTGNLKKSLSGVQILNAGVIQWGGTGAILCRNGTSVKNTGTIYLSNGSGSNSKYPATTATFLNRGFLIDISRGRGATIHGNVMNYGTIKVNEANCEGGLGAIPTPTLITIIGTFGSSTGTFQTTIRSDYYGQLYITGAANINGGTMAYVLSPTSYVPPNANYYDVINAGSIGGSPGDFTTFTPSPFLFAHQKVTSGGRTKYQLYSYN